MQKLNIAMVAACPFPANRGTPSRINGMAEALAAMGHNIHVVTYHFGIPIETKGIRIHRIPRVPYHYLESGPTLTKFVVLDPLLFFKLLRIVKKKKIDIIHAHHFEGALVAYLVRKLTGIKVIYDAHTTLKHELNHYKFIKIKWLSQLLDQKVPKWADHVIVVSQTLHSFVKDSGVVAKKIDVIPTGMNICDFKTGNSNLIRARYGLGKKQVIMYTGSLSPFQSVEYLVRAMKKVFQVFPDAVLVLVVGAENENISQVCRKEGIQNKVIIAVEPTFESVPQYLAAADVVVLPRMECSGIPQKLVNYMAAEKAIVCFQGSAKLLKDNINGLVVEDGNIDLFADSIVRLLLHDSLRDELGRNAKETVIGKYDWPSLCRKLEKVYGSIVGIDSAECSPFDDRRSSAV
jgi:glycosyltransferase involved in cell wall biosynthesis